MEIYENEFKNCQFCDEKILVNAHVCRYCKREQLNDNDLEEMIGAIALSKTPSIILIIISLVEFSYAWWAGLLVLVVGIVIFFNNYGAVKKLNNIELLKHYEKVKVIRKRRIIIFYSIIFLFVFITFISNPNKEDFKVFLKEKTSNYLSESTGFSESATYSFTDKISELVPPGMDNMIKAENYYLFSIYTIDMSLLAEDEHKRIRFIGMYKNFFLLD